MSVVSESGGSDEGWIEWGGGECPVSEDTIVEVRALIGNTTAAAGILAWDYPFSGFQIRAYRIHKESAN